MSFVYTEESLAANGYAGVPTTRISELVYGYQFDPLAPRSRGQPNTQVGAVAGQPSGVTPRRRTGKCVTVTKTWDRAGVESEKQNVRTGRVTKPHIPDERIKECMDWTGDNTPVMMRRLSEYKKRKATKREEIERFSRAYVCTDPRTGRTEVMTARRSGAAHLDLDLNTFDVFGSHKQSLKASTHKISDNLDSV